MNLPQGISVILISLAFFLRFWRYLSGDLARDTAICGLMGLSILRGDFLLLFYGQKFMGSLDAYLSAPLYLLFGPSVLTANFLPLLLSLVNLGALFLLLRRVFRPAGSLMGLLFLAVPTAINLYWVAEGKPFYHLAVFFSVLLMGLSFKMVKDRKEIKGVLFLSWGLWAGLAFWTNFLSGVVIGACAFFVGLGLKGRVPAKPLGWSLLGGVLGLAPLLVFFLSHGWPWLGIVAPGDRFTIADRLGYIFLNTLPIVLGINPTGHTGGLSPSSWTFLLFLLLLGLMAWSGIGLLFKGVCSRRREALLPLLVIILNLGAGLVGGRPQDYRSHDQRYFTLLYLALPFCWAYLAETFDRRRFILVGLIFLMIGVHLSGYRTYRPEGGGQLLGIKSGYFFRQEPASKALIQQLRSEKITHLYSGDFGFAFLADGRPRVSATILYEDLNASAQVDGSINPGFWGAPEPNFQMLGLSGRIFRGEILHSFSRPRGADRLLDRSPWETRSLDGRLWGRVLNDGDLTTGYNTRGSNPDGQGFILDLGREEKVGGFALIPSQYQEIPAGLRIETAGANGVFRLLREVRDYLGPFYLSGPHPFLSVRYPRIECYFSPQTLRYLRLTQLGKIRPDWPVAEIMLFGPGELSDRIPWPQATDLLVSRVAACPLNRLYADAWPSAVLFSRLDRKPHLLLPNHNTDPYGSKIPPPTEPVILDPVPGNGLLISNREKPEVASRLRHSGIASKTVPAGNYTLFLFQGRSEGPPLAIARVSSKVNPLEAEELARGLPSGKRWSGSAPQRPGMGLTIDLGKMETVDFLTLSCPNHPADFPRGLQAEYSPDGKYWHPVSIQLVEPLAFTGQILLLSRGPVQRYRLFPAVQSRYLRLTLSEPDPIYWWSVEAVQVNQQKGTI